MDTVSFACSVRSRIRGLIGVNKYDKTLLLAPCNSIHTYGMLMSIDVAFVDENGVVASVYRDVEPRRLLRQVGAVCVLERMSNPYRPWLSEGDELMLGTLDEPNSQGREV